MNEFKGTPGPWFIGGYGGKNGMGLFVGGNQAPDGCTYICQIEGEDTTKHANAQLIAAAPELLEALQTLVSAIDNGTQMDVMIATDEAEAAIAKALGETK